MLCTAVLSRDVSIMLILEIIRLLSNSFWAYG